MSDRHPGLGNDLVVGVLAGIVFFAVLTLLAIIF